MGDIEELLDKVNELLYVSCMDDITTVLYINDITDTVSVHSNIQAPVQPFADD